jgi:hypothetical protein
MKWVLSKFSESLLALNHLFKDSNSIFISLLKSLRLELVIIILELSANNIDLYFPLIVLHKSFT